MNARRYLNSVDLSGKDGTRLMDLAHIPYGKRTAVRSAMVLAHKAVKNTLEQKQTDLITRAFWGGGVDK